MEGVCYTFDGAAWDFRGYETTADACPGGCAAWQICRESSAICEVAADDDDIYWIICGILGGVVLIAFVLCCYFVCIKKWKRKTALDLD